MPQSVALLASATCTYGSAHGTLVFRSINWRVIDGDGHDMVLLGCGKKGEAILCVVLID